MKSKAHYKKCVELGVVPVPTLVCDDNIDKDAVARLAAGGLNGEESSEEEDESEGEDSEESGSEEHEAAQGLLSLSQPTSNRLPGLLPSGRPTTYPYTLTFSMSTLSTSVVTTTNTSAPLSSQAAAVIQSELSHRYYFPSNRTPTTTTTVLEKSRTSVIIQSSNNKKPTDPESQESIEHRIDDTEIISNDNQANFSQPMDLTTKQTAFSSFTSPNQTQIAVSNHWQTSKQSNILTPVSEPVFMQTIVQTMERLPVQGREWKSEAQGYMLQAYLTERHVMDSKMKLQYRVGSSKLDRNNSEKELQYLKQQDAIRSRNLELNGVPTVTYTDPSKMQHGVIESRIKNIVKQSQVSSSSSSCSSTSSAIEETKIDIIKEKTSYPASSGNERSLDGELVYKDKENPHRLPAESGENFENQHHHLHHHHQQQQILHHQDQQSRANFEMIISTPVGSEIQKLQNSGQEQTTKQLPNSNVESSRNSERSGDVKQNIDIGKQNINDNIKHSVARKMVVGGPGFRSPSPPGGSGKPQAEFLQPSSGPAPNYVR